eukprot:4188242-Prymnesium_polylepis.1
MQLVLVAGSAEEKENFSKSLVAKVGGSVLNMQQLVGAASQEPGPEGEELKALLDQKKLVTVDTQIALLKRAMGTLTPPFLLTDFPRMAAHLKQVEAAVGGVG